MRNLALSIILAFSALLSYAQTTTTTAGKATLNGKILESENGESLVKATVMIMTPDTAKMVKGGTTALDGSFSIKNIEDGNYIVKVSYVGYHNFYRALSVKYNTLATMNLGTVLMVPSSVELSAATVTAQIPEVEVKDDTLMFNADAFKVPEGSVLEDLVKKLPGVEIDENGGITVNGKTVRRILVDGKEFFGNDRDMAMKNIPTEIIKKIKTYERKSDQARLTGIDDGNDETVLDLTIKKGMKNSWVGNLGGGYGTRNRYSARGQINRFQDDFQANVMTNFGNVGGGRGGGGGGNGNNVNGQTGGRIMYNIPDKLEVGGNFRYNYRWSESWTKTASENYTNVNASFNNRYSKNASKSNSFSGDFKLEWKIDSVTTLVIRPNFSFGNSSSSSSNNSASFKKDPFNYKGVIDPLNKEDYALIPDSVKVNESNSSNKNDGTNHNFSTNVQLVRRIKGDPLFGEGTPTGENGRNVSVRANFSTSGNGSNAWNNSFTTYHQLNDSTDLQFRLRKSPSWNRTVSAGVTYAEPILRSYFPGLSEENRPVYGTLFAQVNYGYNYNKRHSDGNNYDFAENDDIGEKIWDYYELSGHLPDTLQLQNFLSSRLSRFSDNTNNTHNVEFSLRYNIPRKINFNAGVQMENQTQSVHQIYMNKDLSGSRNFTRVSPTLNAQYYFSSQHTLRATYRGNSQQPNLTDMFDVEDDSNPLNIRRGNPDLTPSFRNNMSLEYNNYFQETRQSYNLGVNYSNTLNGIETMTEYNEQTGGRISTPVNIDEADWNTSVNAGFNTPLGWEKLTANIRGNYSFNHNVGYINQNKETLKNYVQSHRVGGNLTLTMRLNNIDVRANGSFNWNKSRSELVVSSNQTNYSFNYGLSSTGNFDNGFGYSTDISVRSRRGLSSAAMNTNEVLWNAQISYRFLKRKATITIQANDILNKRSNINRNINANGRTDTENNGIYSYYLATFQYRFTLFGTREARRQLRQEQEEIRESYQNERTSERGNGGNRGGRSEGGNRGGAGGGNRGGGFGGGGRF